MFHHSRRFFDVISCNNFVLALLSPVLSLTLLLSHIPFTFWQRDTFQNVLFCFPFFSRRSIFISSHSLFSHIQNAHVQLFLSLYLSVSDLFLRYSFLFLLHSFDIAIFSTVTGGRTRFDEYFRIYLFFFSLELLDKRCFPFCLLLKYSLLSSLIHRAMITQSGLAFQWTMTVYQIFTQQGPT